MQQELPFQWQKYQNDPIDFSKDMHHQDFPHEKPARHQTVDRAGKARM